MNDPYSVLGLRRDASDEEVKKAYKSLAKKYHPDVTGNDSAAAAKMQEINAAYDEIMNHKNTYSSSYSYNHGSYGGYSQGEEESNELRAAAAYISARHFREALHVLSTVEMSRRNGRWYYLSAVASFYTGDTAKAYSDIAEAIRKEPGNMDYQNFLDRMKHGRSFYSERQSAYAPAGGSFFSCCLPMILLNLFCPGYFCIC